MDVLAELKKVELEISLSWHGCYFSNCIHLGFIKVYCEGHILRGHKPTFGRSIKNLGPFLSQVSSLAGWCVKMEGQWWCQMHISSYASWTIFLPRGHTRRMQDVEAIVHSLNGRFHDYFFFNTFKALSMWWRSSWNYVRVMVGEIDHQHWIIWIDGGWKRCR